MISRIPPLRTALASLLIAMVFAVARADEIRWAARTDVGAPEARAGHVMAYDSDRGVTVMFGGHRLDDFYLIYFNDTWEYDGIAWRRITIDGPSPLPRTASAMCYDSVRHEMVLCAGWNGDVSEDDGYMKDTWVYRPAAPGHGVWVKKTDLRASTSASVARAGHTMVFDTRHKVAVLMGGTLGENSDVGAPDYDRDSHAFVWTGEVWSTGTILFNGLLPNRSHTYYDGPSSHAMVYDSDESVITISGGAYYYHLEVQGSWEFKDLDWSVMIPINARNTEFIRFETPVYARPLGGADIGRRQGHASAYDSDRKRIVIFGGHLAGEDTPPSEDPGARLDEAVFFYLSDSDWDYSSTRLYIPAPPPRELHTMVYDSRRHRMVLFGGSRNLNQYYNDTWEYGPGVVPNIYVNAAHSGSQDGSARSPFKKLSSAVNAASPVDLTVISLTAGDYLESPLTIEKPVRLEAESGPVIVR